MFIADTFHLNDQDEKPVQNVRIKSFWMVLREGSDCTRCKHETYASAKAEAERLARKHLGERFYVLSSEDCVMVDGRAPAPMRKPLFDPLDASGATETSVAIETSGAIIVSNDFNSLERVVNGSQDISFRRPRPFPSSKNND